VVDGSEVEQVGGSWAEVVVDVAAPLGERDGFPGGVAAAAFVDPAGS